YGRRRAVQVGHHCERVPVNRNRPETTPDGLLGLGQGVVRGHAGSFPGAVSDRHDASLFTGYDEASFHRPACRSSGIPTSPALRATDHRPAPPVTSPWMALLGTRDPGGEQGSTIPAHA